LQLAVQNRATFTACGISPLSSFLEIKMGLQNNFKTDQVHELEIREPVVVTPSTPLREAISLIRNRKIGCAIVVDSERKPLGIFTESMLTELLSHGPLPLDDPIEKHMAERCPWVRSTDPVADVLEAMQLKNVRMLCVVDEHEKVVGLTGQRGLMEYVTEYFPGEAMVQRIGQTPFLNDREGA
jgi:CBS domain-containing protein